MKPVIWGIVSTAHINRLVIPGAHASPKVELRAVASRDRARADAYAREWEIPVAYGSYEELLADPEIEALYISLPNTMHAEWSIKAVEAGKHVLCEKPFSRHPEEVEAAFDAAERAGRFLSEAFMWRHNPLRRSSVAHGRGGDRRAAAGARGVRSRSTTRTTSGCGRNRGRGADGRRLLLRERVALWRASRSRSSGGVARAERTDWVFAGDDALPGRRARAVRLRHRAAGARRAGGDRLEGSLFVHDPWHARKPGDRAGREGSVERVELEPRTPISSSSRTSATRSAARRELLLGREDALGQARALEALHRSSVDGQPVALS